MDTSKLRPDTRHVWELLQGHPQLKGFVLIGGTALTLHIGHRISEDLDFAYAAPASDQPHHLPKRQLQALAKDLSRHGVDLIPNPDPLAEEEFLDAGLLLADYQQNHLATLSSGAQVKVSFVCFDPPVTKLMAGAQQDPVRVATMDEIFATKVWAASERSKTRDWFDLYTLLTLHGYRFKDVHAIFTRVNRLPAFNSLCMRLRKCRPQADDEGYASLADQPPTLEHMQEWFNQQIDAWEQEVARDAFKARGL